MITDKEFVLSIYPDTVIHKTDRFGRLEIENDYYYQAGPNLFLVINLSPYWAPIIGSGVTEEYAWKDTKTGIERAIEDKLSE